MSDLADEIPLEDSYSPDGANEVPPPAPAQMPAPADGAPIAAQPDAAAPTGYPPLPPPNAVPSWFGPSAADVGAASQSAMPPQSGGAPPLPGPATSGFAGTPNAGGGFDAAPRPQVDATSGAAPTTEPSSYARNVATANDASAPMAARVKAMHDANMSVDDRARILATMAPQDLAKFGLEQSAFQDDEFNKRHLEIDAQNAAWQSRIAQARIDAANDTMAQNKASSARIDELAARHIQTHPGLGGAVAGVLASTIGGAMSQYTGGRNLGLEQFDKSIERSIEGQKADLDNAYRGVTAKNNLVQQQYALHGDVNRASDELRLATYQRAIGDLETQKQMFDPAGTTALRIAGTQQAMAAAGAQLNQKLQQQNFENALKKQDAIVKAEAEDRQSRTLDATIWKNKQDVGQGWARVGIERDKAAIQLQANAPLPIAALAASTPNVPAPPPGTFPAGTATPKQWDDYIGRVQKNAELGGKQVENQAAEAKNSVSLPIQTGTNDEGQTVVKTTKLANDDGQTWRPPEKFQAMAAGAAGVNQLADQLTRDIKDWGGQSDTVKSDKWQKMKSDYQSLIFALHKAEGIEGFRPGTSDLLHELTGDVDPTSFMRNATAGIQRAKQNINDQLNSEASIGGYTGAPIRFADNSAPPPPKETEIDALAKRAAATPSYDDPADAEYLRRQKGRDEAYGERSPEMLEAMSLGIPPSQVAALQQLSTALENPKTEKAARAALEALTGKAALPAVDEYVNRLLLPNPAAGIPSNEAP